LSTGGTANSTAPTPAGSAVSTTGNSTALSTSVIATTPGAAIAGASGVSGPGGGSAFEVIPPAEGGTATFTLAAGTGTSVINVTTGAAVPCSASGDQLVCTTSDSGPFTAMMGAAPFQPATSPASAAQPAALNENAATPAGSRPFAAVLGLSNVAAPQGEARNVGKRPGIAATPAEYRHRRPAQGDISGRPH
jgi:hypothetical protein